MKRTRKQKIAARHNGANSNGPVTPEGKQRSAQNALKHGLNSSVVVLASENRAEFDRLRDSYLQLWNPQNEPERDLVEDLVAARWRLNRILAMEAAAMDIEMARQRTAVEKEFSKMDSAGRAALAFHSMDSAKYSRYEARLRRTVDRATAELRRLQEDRRTAENTNSQNEPEREPKAPARIVPFPPVSGTQSSSPRPEPSSMPENLAASRGPEGTGRT